MRFLNWLFGKTEQRIELPRGEPTPYELEMAAARLPKPYVDPLTLPVGDFRFIALDVETANSWRGSICQIGIACVGQDNAIQTFSTLIDPQDYFDDFNTQLHGIDARKVQGKPTFAKVLRHIAPLMERQPVFQHSSFDKRAIEEACLGNEPNLTAPQARWLDSVTIARRAWPELSGPGGGHGLANLKKHLKLRFNHHDAGEDARAAALVVLRAEQAMGRDFREIMGLTSGAKPKASKPKTPAPPANEAGPLAGHVAVFTGSLSLSRESAAELAAARGMTVAMNVTLKTTLLIVGDQDLDKLAGHEKSSKHRKAEDYIARGKPIRIITETEFIAMVSEG